jgi:site-specific recombinase XerD
MQTDLSTGLEIGTLVPSWRRSLEARNLSSQTTYIYGRGLDVFLEYLAASGAPSTVGAIRREHIEAALVWMGTATDERPAYSDGSIATFYDGIASFWRWAVAENETDTDPMKNITKPLTPERSIEFPSQAELKRVLEGIKGQDFTARRDRAIVRLFVSSGLRLAELTNLKPSDVDHDAHQVSVMGKGRKPRIVSFGSKAGEALDRYERARADHPNADIPWYWISSKGRMTTSGVRQMLKRRGTAAGIPDLHPHQLRHYFAHEYLVGDLDNGIMPGTPEDLRRILGHTSTKMVDKVYGAFMAEQRANAINRRQNVGDRL